MQLPNNIKAGFKKKGGDFLTCRFKISKITALVELYVYACKVID